MQEFLSLPLNTASLLAGCCVGLATTVLSHVLFSQRRTHESFEESRRTTLREQSPLYQRLEPLVDEVCLLFPDGRVADQLSHSMSLKGDLPPWKASEFMAIKSIEAVFVGAAIFILVALSGMIWLACGLAMATAVAYPQLARHSVIQAAKSRLKSIKLRMPFAIDQISLMMEAGAGFEDSLRTAAADNSEHPLCIELSEILRQMKLGRPRRQAISEFRKRMADDDISEFVVAVVKGEELGSPLSHILREQAAQMRLKRSQWGEKAAAEAEVQMVFPGMLTMVACLLVIIAPILLPVILTLLEG